MRFLSYPRKYKIDKSDPPLALTGLNHSSLYLKCPNRLCPGPARKSTSSMPPFEAAYPILYLPNSLGIPVLDCTLHASHHLSPHCSATPSPPRLPAQTDSRRPSPSGADAELTTRALSAPRGGRGLATTPDTRPIRRL